MPAPPDWLRTFADSVAQTMLPVDILSPLACHFTLQGGVWEITLFASSTEVVGGAKDGANCTSRFTLDLNALSGLLEQVEHFSWQPRTLGSDDDLGPHVAIEGVYQGHPVWLRVLARAPRRFSPGRIAHGYELAWEDLW